MNIDCKILSTINHGSNPCYIIDYKGKKRFLKILGGKLGVDNPTEIDIHCSVIHPSILNAVAIRTWNINSESHLGIILPVATSNLIDYLMSKNLSKDDRLGIACQCVTAVYALHRSGYLHLDIKLDNFLICSNKVYITDFGYSRRSLSDEYLIAIVNHSYNVIPYGTLIYAAPELLSLVGEYSIYNEEIDVYALGHLLLGILSSKRLTNIPTRSNRDIIYQSMMKLFPTHQHLVDRVKSLLIGYDDVISDMIASMLSFEPSVRPSIKTIIDTIPRCNQISYNVRKIEPPITPSQLISFEADINNIISVFTLHLSDAHLQTLFMAVDLYHRVSNQIINVNQRILTQAACVWLALKSTFDLSTEYMNQIIHYFNIEDVGTFQHFATDIIILLDGILCVNLLYYAANTIDEYKYMINNYFYHPDKYAQFAMLPQPNKLILYIVKDII